MATQVQFRRGTTGEHSGFTGAVGEVTVDTEKKILCVHDATTPGGFPLLQQDGSNRFNEHWSRSGTTSNGWICKAYNRFKR